MRHYKLVRLQRFRAITNMGYYITACLNLKLHQSAIFFLKLAYAETFDVYCLTPQVITLSTNPNSFYLPQYFFWHTYQIQRKCS